MAHVGVYIGVSKFMKITIGAPRRCVLHTAPGRQGGQATALRTSIASRFSNIGRGLTEVYTPVQASDPQSILCLGATTGWEFPTGRVYIMGIGIQRQ